MVWITQMQTQIVCWILLLSRATLSLQESTNQTSQQGEGAGPGSGPSSENSDTRAANEDVREATVSGNKTFRTFQSLPSVKESTNSSIEKVSQSLTRLEGSLGSLIQSFLAMQRSVSNMEQLQELLVLLLEDILKQADNKVKSLKAIKKEIDTNYGDPNTKTSKESNEDIGGDADRNTPSANNRAVENGGVKTYVNDEDFSVLSGRLGGSIARQADTNNVNGKEETADSTPPSADANDSGASSREGSSNSDENDNVPRAKSPGETKTSPPTESFDRSPQWAEPMSVERGNFLAMFREALSRLMHKSPASIGQQFQQMRLLREDHEINAVPGESPAEAPPRSFEPLEVKTDVNNFLDKKSISQERLPVQVRLHHLSQVIRHAGPIDGPEKSKSPFLEDLSGTVGKDYSGERPTGMINDLQLPESVADIFTNDSSEETKLTSNITLQNVPRSVRKRRQAEIQSKHWSKLDASTNGSVLTVTDVAKLQSLREELNSSKKFLNYSSSDTSNVYNITDLHNHSNDGGVPGTAWQDYDHLIDALLKDLSAKLQEYQSQQASSDAAIDRAVYELNKLIWVSTFENEFGAMNSSDTPRNKAVTGSESVQFISQPMISAAEESINKGMQLIAGNESTPLNETALYSTYTVKSRTKSALFKAKEMMMEAENNSKISLQRTSEDEQVNLANLSESSDWVWLTYMPSAMKLPEADLKLLIDTLTILTQRQDLATDMTDIIRRAWDLTHKKLDSNTMRHGEDRSAEAGPDDLQDDEELDVDAEGQNTRSLIRDNTSANSLFGDISEQLSNTPSNSIDESVQQVINALKHFLQQEDSLNNDQSHLRSTHRNHEKGSRGQDTLENEDGDSEEISREEDRGNHNSYMNALLHGGGGQQRKEPEEYPMFALQKQIQPMGFAEYFRNKREGRSRHKRLSGMLLKQFTNPQTPSDNMMSNHHISNQDGSHSAGQQTQLHQTRNTSVPHSNGPQTMLYQNNLYNHLRRHSTNEPWGRLQRHYNYPWGYSNYMNHLGINHPNWIHRALEPDEPPSTDMQGSMDVEDALAALFQRYWQRLFDVYSRSSLTTTTTEEPDYDGENTTPLANIQLEENITHITASSPATITTTDILSLIGQPASANIRGNRTTLVKK